MDLVITKGVENYIVLKKKASQNYEHIKKTNKKKTPKKYL